MVAAAGEATFNAGIVIADAGLIGSASDKDAIAIGSDGDVTLTQDLELQHDGAILSFGADDDVTITHVHDTGILLNSTMAIQFNDASQSINAPSNAILDINATDEIELNATLLDVNANINASGTYTGAGTMTTGGNIVIPDAGNIGSASDTDAIAIGSDGDVTLTQDLELQHDGAILSFGANDDVTVTHVHNTGLLLNAAMVMQFRDSAINIGSPADGDLDINADDEIELNSTLIDINGAVDISGATTVGGILKTDDATEATSTTDGSLQTDGGLSVVKDIVAGDDIKLLSDAAVVAFGANSEITLTHVHDVGLTVTNTINGTDNRPTVLQLKSEEDAIVANDVIASIEMAAGDSDGTDGATVAAGIHAIAEDTFSASANKTKLVFTTGVSETAASSATAKMTLSSAGLLTIADDLVIKDGGTIGSASDTDAIAIGSDGDVTLTQDLELQHDGAILSFGANDDVTVTHVHDTGLLINAAMVMQFRDSAINIGSPADGDLDINADDEIELNSTLIDVNGNLDVSGTIVGASTLSATTGTFSGILKTDDATEATSTTDGSLQTDGGLSVVKDAVFGDDIKLLSDAAVAAFGANGDVTLTHVHNTGLLLNAAMVMQFRDSAINIGSPADGDLDINADDEIELNSTLIDVNGNLDVSGTIVGASTLSATTGTFSGILKTDDATEATSTTDGSLQTDGGLSVVKDAVFGDDVLLLSDAAVIKFGANSDVTLTHVADAGLTLSVPATADNSFPTLTLAAGDNDIAANDVLGALDFVAPAEGAGTDAVAVAGSVRVISEGNFAADNNASKMSFMLGSSEAATEKMSLSSAGVLATASLDISGDVDIDGTLEADAITVNGTTLAETISDTVGAMVGCNTETGIAVTYQDGDNTIDFAINAAQTTITSLLATDIKIGEDDQTKIDFETADEIHFYAANAHQIKLVDGAFSSSNR